MGDTGFIGSMMEGGEGLLLLRGVLPPDAGTRVAEHLDDLLAAGARHVRVDGRGAAGVDEDVLHALVDAQQRLVSRRGMVSVVGLRPTAPTPAPVSLAVA